MADENPAYIQESSNGKTIVQKTMNQGSSPCS